MLLVSLPYIYIGAGAQTVTDAYASGGKGWAKYHVTGLIILGLVFLLSAAVFISRKVQQEINSLQEDV